ncbi:MAG: tetratricopeptide repeat protein [Myxococcales bacterium]
MRTYGSLLLLFAASGAGAAPDVPAKPAETAAVATKSDVQEPVPGERARRLLDEALLSLSTARKLNVLDTDVLTRFRAAAEAAKDSVPALLDYAVALDRAGKLEEAEAAYRAAAGAPGAADLRFATASRAAALAVARGDDGAARSAVQLAVAAMPGESDPLQLEADVALALGDAHGAQAAARRILARDPEDVDALCALARAHLMLGSPGTANVLAGRAARIDPQDAEPFLVEAEVARSRSDAPGEMAAVRAAAAADEDSAEAALALGRVLFERGQSGEAIDELMRAADLAPDAAAVHLALGVALASADRKPEAVEHLALAARLAPRSPEPHYELARLHLEGLGDAKAALEQAKLFLRLSTKTPPPGHPIHALLQRCEEALKSRTQASVVQ